MGCRRAGRIAAEVLVETGAHVRPGITIDEPSATTRLVPGPVLTVEPMLTAGSPHNRLATD